MAVKYICDGCAREVPHDLVRRTTARVEFTGGVTGSGGQYELCQGCANHLVKMVDPRKWPRAAAAE